MSTSPPNLSPRRRASFGSILLFARQVIAELRKVVTPTRKELFPYTVTVVASVAIMILFVALVDLGFGTLSSLLFSGSPTGDNCPRHKKGALPTAGRLCCIRNMRELLGRKVCLG